MTRSTGINGSSRARAANLEKYRPGNNKPNAQGFPSVLGKSTVLRNLILRKVNPNKAVKKKKKEDGAPVLKGTYMPEYGINPQGVSSGGGVVVAKYYRNLVSLAKNEYLVYTDSGDVQNDYGDNEFSLFTVTAPTGKKLNIKGSYKIENIGEDYDRLDIFSYLTPTTNLPIAINVNTPVTIPSTGITAIGTKFHLDSGVRALMKMKLNWYLSQSTTTTPYDIDDVGFAPGERAVFNKFVSDSNNFGQNLPDPTTSALVNSIMPFLTDGVNTVDLAGNFGNNSVNSVGVEYHIVMVSKFFNFNSGNEDTAVGKMEDDTANTPVDIDGPSFTGLRTALENEGYLRQNSTEKAYVSVHNIDIYDGNGPTPYNFIIIHSDIVELLSSDSLSYTTNSNYETVDVDITTPSNQAEIVFQSDIDETTTGWDFTISVV